MGLNSAKVTNESEEPKVEEIHKSLKEVQIVPIISMFAIDLWPDFKQISILVEIMCGQKGFENFPNDTYPELWRQMFNEIKEFDHRMHNKMIDFLNKESKTKVLSGVQTAIVWHLISIDSVDSVEEKEHFFDILCLISFL